MRDEVVNRIEAWRSLTSIPRTSLLAWASIQKATYYAWSGRQGLANRHKPPPHQSHWTLPHELEAVITSARENPGERYRRLTSMMIDADVVYLSPATVYCILSAKGMLGRPPKPSMKATGFKEPKASHSHWHIDFTYLNLSGTFHFLSAILDDYSRAILS